MILVKLASISIGICIFVLGAHNTYSQVVEAESIEFSNEDIPERESVAGYRRYYRSLSAHQSPPLMVKQPTTNEVLFQVAQREDEADRPFLIECEAEGDPPPKYSWIKNGKEFNWQAYDDRISQQPGRGTLVITAPRDEDVGQYQCYAKNEWGTATSNSVFVRKAELDSFKDDEVITPIADEGKPYKLPCNSPHGWPKPELTWIQQSDQGALKIINSSRITVDPEGHLWFSNITRKDRSSEFYYTCAAFSPFRNEYKLGNRVYLQVNPTNDSASLNKHHPVAQYTTKRVTVALRGDDVDLWCIIGGTPLPEIKWARKGGLLSNDRVIYRNYGKTLRINNVDFSDEGRYDCDATNGVRTPISHSIQLNVYSVPYFTVEPDIANAAEGERVRFRCEANGKPSPEIKWIHNGKPLEQATPNPRRRVIGGNTIVIENLKKEDTGNYGCNATNSFGYVYKDVYVNVRALPAEIIEPPMSVFATDGNTIMLRCRVFGAPKPLVRWIRDGQELTGGRYKLMDSGDLEISSVTFVDAGDYTCVARNKFGTDSASGQLVVKEHTRIVDRPEDFEVAAGTTATFRCSALADSTLTLTIDWLSDNQTIDFEVEQRYVKLQDNSLTIDKTTELDSGVYTCVARTEYDSARADATLVVQDVPNRPELKGVDCGRRDATIRWKAMGDNRAPILHYTIDYNTSFTPDSWEVAYNDVSPALNSYTVLMSPWGNYSFRVTARNKIGPSLPSLQSAVCTTPVDVPFNNPDNVKGHGNRPDNLVISWTPMPEIEHNAPRFRYVVQWKLQSDNQSRWEREEIKDWKTHEIIISDQPTYRPYKIRIRAVNEQGESNVAPTEVIGWSGQDVPLEAPSNFTLLTEVDSKTVVVSWNGVNSESLRGKFEGYKVQHWTDEDDIQEVLVEGNAKQAAIEDLVPYSKNYLRVLSYNTDYNGPPSRVMEVVTGEGVPDPVESFEAFPLSMNSFYLIWRRPERPNGLLKGYEIYFQKVIGTRIGPLLQRTPGINSPDTFTAKLSSLEAGTKYRIHIAATTSVGEGQSYYIEESTYKVAPTEISRPGFTWSQEYTEKGASDIKVRWLPNFEESGGSGSHFYVQYKPYGEKTFKNTEPEFYEDYLIVRGLDPRETYIFRVIAVDGMLQKVSDAQEIPKLLPLDKNNITTVPLVMKESTRIVERPEDDEVAAGTTATFRCSAVADSTLTLTIDWLSDFQAIDLETEKRYVKVQDNSLTIYNTTALDSGVYTCVARTEYDSARADATLEVQDVPNRPELRGIDCGRRDATIRWKAMGDNRAPILHYTIQYNTSFTPDSWEVAYNDVSPALNSHTVLMSPWVNYSFRVIARNKIGASLPSLQSDVCTTPVGVPFKNPDNVKGHGNRPDNLVISWTPMPEIEHNAPRFRYIVQWKLQGESQSRWEREEIKDSKRGNLTIPNQPTYKAYTIRVRAVNEEGESNIAPTEIVGWSGHGVPLEAPSNFTIVSVTNAKSVIVSWNRVSDGSLQGIFKSYKIHHWTDGDKKHEVLVNINTTRAILNDLVPFSKNNLQILVQNTYYSGPLSRVVEVVTPEGIPGPVDSFEVHSLGMTSFYLTWKKPKIPNGILTGHEIYYQKISGTEVGPINRRPSTIQFEDNQSVKLNSMEVGTKYRISICAKTRVGEGECCEVERTTNGVAPSALSTPGFSWSQAYTEDGSSAVKVRWLPNFGEKAGPGSHFYVQYKFYREKTFKNTSPELEEDFSIVGGLAADETYVFRVVAVDGKLEKVSEVQQIDILDYGISAF